MPLNIDQPAFGTSAPFGGGLPIAPSALHSPGDSPAVAPYAPRLEVLVARIDDFPGHTAEVLVNGYPLGVASHVLMVAAGDEHAEEVRQWIIAAVKRASEALEAKYPGMDARLGHGHEDGRFFLDLKDANGEPYALGTPEPEPETTTDTYTPEGAYR